MLISKWDFAEKQLACTMSPSKCNVVGWCNLVATAYRLALSRGLVLSQQNEAGLHAISHPVSPCFGRRSLCKHTSFHYLQSGAMEVYAYRLCLLLACSPKIDISYTHRQGECQELDCCPLVEKGKATRNCDLFLKKIRAINYGQTKGCYRGFSGMLSPNQASIPANSVIQCPSKAW